jgi:hypothetical protein
MSIGNSVDAPKSAEDGDFGLEGYDQQLVLLARRNTRAWLKRKGCIGLLGLLIVILLVLLTGNNGSIHLQQLGLFSEERKTGTSDGLESVLGPLLKRDEGIT